jgi:hypothetical protein
VAALVVVQAVAMAALEVVVLVREPQLAELTTLEVVAEQLLRLVALQLVEMVALES